MTGRVKHAVSALVQAFEIDQLPLTGVKGLTAILKQAQTTFDTGYHLQSLSDQVGKHWDPTCLSAVALSTAGPELQSLQLSGLLFRRVEHCCGSGQAARVSVLVRSFRRGRLGQNSAPISALPGYGAVGTSQKCLRFSCRLQALAGWHLILDKYKSQPVSKRLAAMAVEDGALHTHSLALQHKITWWLDDDSTGDPGTEAAVCGERLDEVAQQVTLSQPEALP